MKLFEFKEHIFSRQNAKTTKNNWAKNQIINTEVEKLTQLQIKIESMETYTGLWEQTRDTLSWHCPFVLPFWLQAVERHLGFSGQPHIVTVYEDQTPIGIVPLAIDEGQAGFLGPHNVCDYQDFVTAPKSDTRVLAAALDHLAEAGIKHLDLRTLRPDARILAALNDLADQRALQITSTVDDVSFETDLPRDWEDYLMQLSGKQRHEVRRKLRRLDDNGPYTFREVSGLTAIDEETERFLELFHKNRRDKAEFMTAAMSDYFKDIIQGLAQQGMLRLGFLEVEDQPVATVLCFDFQGGRYLYNNGYDSTYDALSVGILSKVFSIQGAIESGCRNYDFLKGQEVYKGRIGGKQMDLYHYTIDLG